MRLLELFDKVAKYNIVRQDTLVHTSAIFEAEFWVGEGVAKRRYEVRMHLNEPQVLADEAGCPRLSEYVAKHIDSSETMMEVSFVSENPNSVFRRAPDTEDNITGRGNQFEVMATVVDITKYAVKRYTPARVVFASLETSRTKLYRHMASRLGANPIEFQVGRATYFLVKP